MSMPSSRVLKREEIIHHLSRTNNISEISRETGYSRDLIRTVKNSMEKNQSIFIQKEKLGRPTVMTTEIQNEIKSLTMANRRMGLKDITNIINQNPMLPNLHKSSTSNLKGS